MKSSRIHSSSSQSYSSQSSQKFIQSNRKNQLKQLEKIQSTLTKTRQHKKANYISQSLDDYEEIQKVSFNENDEICIQLKVQGLLWEIKSSHETKYLTKFIDHSHLNCKWLTERELKQNYFFQITSRVLVSLKKRIQKTMSLKLKDNVYFNPNYLIPERILLSTDIFAAIHHRKANDIKGKWNESIMMVCSKLVNFVKNDFQFGVQLLQTNPQNSQIYKQFSQNNQKKVGQINFIRILNRIYLDVYHCYAEFWNQLGAAIIKYQQNNKNSINRFKISQVLKQCCIFLYKQWYILSLRRYNNLKNINSLQVQQKGQNQFEFFIISLCKENIFLTQKCIQSPKNIQELELLNPKIFNMAWLDNQDKKLKNYFFIHLTKQDMKMLDLNTPIQRLFLIKWKQLGYLKSTWQNEKRLNCNEQIQQYKNYNKIPAIQIRDQQQVYIQIQKNLMKYNAATIMKNKVDSSTIATAKKMYFLGKKTFNQPKQYTESQIYKNYKQLKKFQIESLNWLIKSWYENRNTILADEMGLGKTVQIIAFLHHLYTYENVLGPFLILAPLTTLQQWKKQIQDWTHFNCLLYYDEDSQRGRNFILEHEFYYKHVTKEGQIVISTINKFTILLTNYQIFSIDYDLLIKIPFQHIILDEAHRLKNNKAKTTILLKQLPCVRKNLLTGTPIQNNTQELWSLLNFIQPHIFESEESFLRRYGNLNTQEEVKEFKRMLKPYMLRRVKEDVQTTIPRLSQIIVEVEMTKIQKDYYRGILQKNKNNFLNKQQFSNTAMQLRKCCNHPFLIMQEYDQQSTILSSGKLILVLKLLTKFKKENKKVLLFSQFVTLLQFIKPTIQNEGFNCEILTGSLSAKERHQAITRFNSSEHKVDVFLISTKAGGVGINLVSATEVIIYDSDWNPQNDIQATARAHRIGQKNEVTVYRLITANSYEQEMFRMASKKLGLDKAVLSGECFKSGGEFLQNDSYLSKKDIEMLLKRGIIGFLQNNKDGNKFYEQSIEEILQKNSRKIEYQINDKSCAFSKTKFQEKQFSNAVIEDKNFWSTALTSIESPIDKLVKKRYQLKSYKTEEEQQNLMVQIFHFIIDFLKQKTNLIGTNFEDENNLIKLLKQISQERSFLRYLRNVADKLLEQVQKPSRRFKVKLEHIIGDRKIKFQDKLSSSSIKSEKSPHSQNYSLTSSDKKQGEKIKKHRSKNKVSKNKLINEEVIQKKSQIKKRKKEKRKQQHKQIEPTRIEPSFDKEKKEEQIQSKSLQFSFNQENNKSQKDKDLQQKNDEQQVSSLIQKTSQKQLLKKNKYYQNSPCALCFLPKCTYFCAERCGRSFHKLCWTLMDSSLQKPPSAIQLIESGLNFVEWQSSLQKEAHCSTCIRNMVTCCICNKESSQLLRCSSNCNKFYHTQCLYLSGAKFSDRRGRVNTKISARGWKCPHHICQICQGALFANRQALGCVQCYCAYHLQCAEDRIVELAKRKIICRKHIQNNVEYIKMEYKAMTIPKRQISIVQKKRYLEKNKQKQIHEQASLKNQIKQIAQDLQQNGNVMEILQESIIQNEQLKEMSVKEEEIMKFVQEYPLEKQKSIYLDENL